MQLIRGLHNLTIQPQASIVTIGNFDGVHLGHQQILQQMLAQALAENLVTAVIIFEPQPKEYFMQENAPKRIMPWREKVLALKQLGITKVVCLRFNTMLENLSPQAFIDKIIVKKLRARYLWVGEDFRFGHKQQGDIHLLEQLAKHYHFQVMLTSTLKNAGAKISSTAIRDLLQQGEMKQAAALLGRPLALSGRVAQGAQRGRSIGFPTANMNLPRYSGCLAGVYAVRVTLGCEVVTQPQFIFGVANIGMRPTFDGHSKVLEVHLFDFADYIYGCSIKVEFIHKLRDEQRFADIEALKQQITQDVEQAKQYFATYMLPNI